MIPLGVNWIDYSAWQIGVNSDPAQASCQSTWPTTGMTSGDQNPYNLGVAPVQESNKPMGCLWIDTTPRLRVLTQAAIVLLTITNSIIAQNAAPFESIALRGLAVKTPEEGITFEEKDLYYQTIQQILELPQQTLEEAAIAFREKRHAAWKASQKAGQTFSSFADLYFYPQANQGHALTLRGHLQRLIRLPPDESYPEVPPLYEAWLFPEGAQQNPTVVITGSVPDDWPLGDVTIDQVQVTGIFYRHYTYRGQGEKRYAPLIIAQRLTSAPPEIPQPQQQQALWTKILLIALAAALFLPPILYLTMRRPTPLPFDALINTNDDLGPSKDSP